MYFPGPFDVYAKGILLTYTVHILEYKRDFGPSPIDAAGILGLSDVYAKRDLLCLRIFTYIYCPHIRIREGF